MPTPLRQFRSLTDAAALFLAPASRTPGALRKALRESRRGIEGIAYPCLAECGDVLETKLNRVHPDRLRQGIQHLLQRPRPLRMARGAKGAGGQALIWTSVVSVRTLGQR